MSAAPRSARLRLLLRGLGPPAAEAGRRPEAARALKARYRALARECHPDLAPQGAKEEATRAFAQLQADFQEALALMEAGGCAAEPAGGTKRASDYDVRFHFDPEALLYNMICYNVIYDTI